MLFTTALGVLVVWGGMEASRFTGGIFPFLAGGVLILFGAYYLWRYASGNGHGHHHFLSQDGHGHDHHEAGHDHHDHAPVAKTDIGVIVGLFALLTFSPCEGFLPVYLTGVHYGWTGFVILSVVLAGATLAGMVTFTSLTLAGLQRFKFDALERYESAILGGMLCLLGVLVMVFEQ